MRWLLLAWLTLFSTVLGQADEESAITVAFVCNVTEAQLASETYQMSLSVFGTNYRQNVISVLGATNAQAEASIKPMNVTADPATVILKIFDDTTTGVTSGMIVRSLIEAFETPNSYFHTLTYTKLTVSISRECCDGSFRSDCSFCDPGRGWLAVILGVRVIRSCSFFLFRSHLVSRLVSPQRWSCSRLSSFR